jgi:hypothetical protein
MQPFETRSAATRHYNYNLFLWRQTRLISSTLVYIACAGAPAVFRLYTRGRCAAHCTTLPLLSAHIANPHCDMYSLQFSTRHDTQCNTLDDFSCPRQELEFVDTRQVPCSKGKHIDGARRSLIDDKGGSARQLSRESQETDSHYSSLHVPRLLGFIISILCRRHSFTADRL